MSLSEAMSVHEYIRTCAISRRHRAALENDSIAPIILNAYRKLMKEQTKICEHCARWRSKEHTFCEAHRYRSMVTGQLNWKDAADEDDIEWFHALEPSPESTQESHGKWRKKRFKKIIKKLRLKKRNEEGGESNSDDDDQDSSDDDYQPSENGDEEKEGTDDGEENASVVNESKRDNGIDSENKESKGVHSHELADDSDLVEQLFVAPDFVAEEPKVKTRIIEIIEISDDDEVNDRKRASRPDQVQPPIEIAQVIVGSTHRRLKRRLSTAVDVPEPAREIDACLLTKRTRSDSPRAP